MTENVDNPDEFDWVSELVKFELGSMRVVGIGVVQKVSPKGKRRSVSVRSVIDYRRMDPLELEVVPYTPAPVHNVPILDFHGNQMFISFPVKVGDFGVMLMCDRSNDEWLTTGKNSNAPLDPRRFDESDTMFLPCGRPFTDPIEHVDPRGESLVLGDDRTNGVRLKINPDGTVRFGTGAVDILTQISEIAAVLSDTASSTGTSTVPTSSGPKPLSNAATLIALSTQASAIKSLVDQLLE